MTTEAMTSEWTGIKGRIGAWYLASRLRRLSEILVLGNLRPRFLEAVRLRGDEVVVDAGSGSGFYSLAVAENLPRGRLICVDLSDEMLAHLKRRTATKGLADRVEVRKGDVTALELADGSADLAISNGVWHELPDPSRAAVEIFRVLKPGGRVVVTDFRDTGLGKRIGAAHRSTDHGPWSVEQLVKTLEGVGFTEVAGEAVRTWVIAWGAKRK